MLSGHFATALAAKQKFPKGNLLYFLIASQLQDLLWILFHYLGLEITEPKDVFSVSMNSLNVNMMFSHDLLTQLIWAVVVFSVGKWLFKRNDIAIAGALLTFGHFILDLISGYPHFVFGPESHSIGLGLYHTNIYLAIAIEFVFTSSLFTFYIINQKKQDHDHHQPNYLAIGGLYAFGIIFFLLVGTTSLRESLGIPEMDIAINTNVLNLIFTYGGLIYLFNRFALKTDVK